MKKQLIITTGFKGGLGKSELAKNILPIIIYNISNAKFKKFKIVEIDDTETIDNWTSDVVQFKKFSVANFKEGVAEVQKTVTDPDVVEILDIGGGGEKVEKILTQLKKMDLDLFYEFKFFVPTLRTSSIYNSTLETLKLIHKLFGVKSSLVYNRVISDYKQEFKAIFGFEEYQIQENRSSLLKYINDEYVVYEDINDIVQTVLDQTRKSSFDFYLMALDFNQNYRENRLKAKTEDEINQITKLKTIVADFLEFFEKIEYLPIKESKNGKWAS